MASPIKRIIRIKREFFVECEKDATFANMKMKMMKKKLLFLILLIVSVTGRAQNLCGTFTGKLEVGAMKLTIVLNINADGLATLESPDQTNQKIPATTDFLSADSVAVSVAMLRASYK